MMAAPSFQMLELSPLESCLTSYSHIFTSNLLENPVGSTFRLDSKHDICHPPALLLAWIILRVSSKAWYCTVSVVPIFLTLDPKARMALLKVKSDHVTSLLKTLELHSSFLRVKVKIQIMTYRHFMV